MNNREQATRLEHSTIEPIPLDQRHGTAADLFTVWFGSNLMLLTIVTGGLAVTVFALPFGWAVIGLVIGNLVGAIFMALHAAQGPTLGVPQMIQTRGQFGSLGSLLVVGIVIIMYVGFLSSNLVLGGEALTSLAPGLSDIPGIALVGVISIIAAIWGHDLIHAYARVMSYLLGAVLLLTVAWIIWVHGLPADFLSRNSASASGLLGTISAAALWQIAYAPYVSDYSRYMPRDTGARPAFWASYWGCTLGSVLPMVLGAMVGLAAPKGNLVMGLASLTRGIAPLVLVAFSIGVATANAMNLYCGALSTLTFGQTLFPRWLPRARARIITVLVLFGLSLAGALLGKDSFLENYTDFILLLLYVLVPWTAINLVDYYLLRHGQYDVPSFFRQDGGVYGRVNGVAVECYVIGILVQLPLVATPLYTGPIARAIGGVDLSWIVGLAVTGPGYYWLARRSMARRNAQLARAGQLRA
ncbi:MAG TPA: cytosine permease [Steroidobacteraceae bacterium]|jgi:NCS1 family nucleobase:cation symporter-1|nr:cytosine permease [Steroidobacteraceae bacterium]